MSILSRVVVTISLLLVALLPFACNADTSDSVSPLPPPAGAASGLNTFIYVYSDT